MTILIFIVSFLILAVHSVPVEESRDEIKSVEPEYLDALLAQERYEEFSSLMGIDNPHLSMPRTENETGDPSMFKELFHGDILLTPEQQEQARQGINFAKYGGSRWSLGSVPYSLSSQFSASQRDTIMNGINTWNSQLSNCVTFKPRASEAAYVFFFPGDGCYSNLGRTGKQQSLSLGNGCVYHGIILHEMEHACGMDHEHNRPDRDNHVDILWNNIPKDWQSQYQKASDSDFWNILDYNCASVMHYGKNAPNTRNPAFNFKNCADQSKVGQRENFHPTDVQKVKKLYGC